MSLGLEASELQAEYRPALTEAGRLGQEAEIYVYDTLPGGAGFVRRVGELGLHVFEDALDILEHCPEQCDRSCYRCLRSYKNKLEHDLLDRQLGASLLRFLLDGTSPALDESRLNGAIDLLFEDLQRHGLNNATMERNGIVGVEGIGDVTAPILVRRNTGDSLIVGLHNPLTPDEPHDDQLRDVKEYAASCPVLLVDEILVRRNLPRATTHVMSRIG